MLTIVGPTATGKTALAVALANALDGEILSGDSRQVYRRMDIGTGKDIDDYTTDGRTTPYHLIDICDPGEKYNLFEYQKDFAKAYADVCAAGKLPILCGGSGLYVEAVLKGYQLFAVPENRALRSRLAHKSLSELTTILSGYKILHNTTDVDTPKRAIRAIEIEEYSRQQKPLVTTVSPIDSLIVGVAIDREERRKRISRRLATRLEEGMIEEVKSLLDSGIPAEDLIYYGLEYKYLTLYLTSQLTRQEMISQLEIAIHQFAKRQMTWFRGMERRGFVIHWIDALLPMDEKVEQVIRLYK